MGDPGVRLTVSGLLRGHDLAGDAMVALDEDVLRIDSAGGALRLPLAWLDGARYAVGTLELFMTRGDVVVMSGSPALGTLATQLERRVMMIPELTRSLRGLGSGRAAPGPEHDRFFGALLAARREAEAAPSPDRARAAFDAAALRDALIQRLHDMAGDHHPDEPPERRALDAELLELAEPLLAQLGLLERKQEALASSDDAERLARWREWAAALHVTFERADAVWLEMVPALASDRPTRAKRWNRRGGGARRRTRGGEEM
jgi:hypothetical protein